MKRTNLFFVSMFALLVFAGTLYAASPWGPKKSGGLTISDNLPHPQDTMYYMEQWSGTVKFGKDHDVNFNLIHSNLTAKSNKAIFRVEYNTPDGKKLKDSKRCKIKSAASPFLLACGDNIITKDGEKFKLRFKGSKMSLSMILTPLVPAFRPGSGRLKASDKSNKFYDFALMVPRGKALVKVGDKVLKGYGSIDHSYANAGLHTVAKHWIRTTYHDKDKSILLAVNIDNSGKKSGWFSVADNSGSFSSSDMSVTLSDFYKDGDKKGYSAPASIQMQGPGGFMAKMEKMNMYSRKSMLENLSTVEKFVVKRFSDPMRYAFKGNAVIDWPKAGVMQRTEQEIVFISKQMNK